MTTQEILQGIHDWTNRKIVYDISVAHPDGQGNPTPYADLTAALGTNGANIPADIRRGGMSIKFIQGNAQSSDNNYVQFMYMGTSTSVADFTNVDNWQGVDDEPMPESNNLAESGGVYAVNRINGTKIEGLYNKFYFDANHLCSASGDIIGYISSPSWDSAWIAIISGSTQITVTGATVTRYRFFSDFDNIDYEHQVSNNKTGVVPNGAVLCIIAFKKSDNPDGYDNLEITQDNKIVTSLENESQRKFDLLNKIFIAYDHILDWTSAENMRYHESSYWDCAFYSINGEKQITLEGATGERFMFFSSIDTFDATTFLDCNPYGNVPDSAKLCVFNLEKEYNPNGYGNIRITAIMKDAAEAENNAKDFVLDTFGNNIVIVKNLIDINNLLYGKYIASGQWVDSENGICTNKLYFEDGKTYAMQGIGCYGTQLRIFIGYFDEQDNFLGRTGYDATLDDPNVKRGKATFTYSAATFANTAYCRVVLKGPSTATLDTSLCQIELGNQYTQVVEYNEVARFNNNHFEGDARKKKIRLLSIGNSYSQDALAYVPFILQNMGVDVDIQIGILMMSSSTLQDHVDNFNNETAAYTFYLYNGGMSWQNLGSNTIQWALDNYEWDIITLQQSSGSVFTWSTYQPYLNQLINLIGGYVNYQIKFGWYAVQARPASSNSGANWDDATITSHYESIAENSQKVMNQTVCEFLVPVDTAIQNARSIATLKALGDYANNQNNTSGLGYLTPNDGVHLQEGLPSQIAAYTFVLKLLDIYGFDEYSINAESTRVTTEWAANKNIPGPHGDYIGSTDANCLIAQASAIMAVKNPYEMTDMNYIVNPT